MNIIYKITYLPHLKSETPPYYYIGSKFNYKGKYYGSPSSKQKDWFTCGLSIRDWWRAEIAKNPDNFKFEIISEHNRLSPVELVEVEKLIHLEHDVKESNLYFNKAIATTGWASTPKTQLTKQLMSEKTKKYWDTEEGMKKRQRLSERNKKHKSKEMKERWKNPSEKMKTMPFYGRPKGAKDLQKRKPREQRKVEIDGVVYDSAKEASKIYNIHPVNVRRRCREDVFENWRYIE